MKKLLVVFLVAGLAMAACSAPASTSTPPPTGTAALVPPATQPPAASQAPGITSAPSATNALSTTNAAATPTTAAAPATTAPAATGQAAAIDPTRYTFVQVAQGFHAPVVVTNAGDGTGRLFVVEQGGTIRVVQNGAVLPQPFIDLTSLVTHGGSEEACWAWRSTRTTRSRGSSTSTTPTSTAIHTWRATTYRALTRTWPTRPVGRTCSRCSSRLTPTTRAATSSLARMAICT